jgi:Protein of unknown function (DUF3592)
MIYIPFVVLGLVGLFFCATGIVTLFDAWAVRRWASAASVVKHIAAQKISSMDGDAMQDKLYFEFLHNGLPYQGTVITSSKKYAVGQSLNLRYNPIKPSDYRVEIRGQTMVTMILACVGGAMLVAGYIHWPTT